MDKKTTEEEGIENFSFDTKMKVDKKFLKNIGQLILSQDKNFFKEFQSKLQEVKTDTTKSLEGFYTVKEVAEKLNLGATTVRRMIADERIEATRPTKSYIITQEALDKFINSHKDG